MPNHPSSPTESSSRLLSGLPTIPSPSSPNSQATPPPFSSHDEESSTSPNSQPPFPSCDKDSTASPDHSNSPLSLLKMCCTQWSLKWEESLLKHQSFFLAC